ncbi:MAG TPA: thioredoxin [Thioalkalivibrio sp.]|nr:thioredoxin [Thioalkalivibrio sp.]
MKVELVVSEWCQTCHQAEKVWRGIAEKKAIEFAVVDMGQPEGRELATRLRIRSIPAIVLDGELAQIGVHPEGECLKLVAGAPDRKGGGARHVGLGLSTGSRAAILAAMGYVFVAGGFLPLGGLFGEGHLRPLPLHLFTVGFMTFLVYGLAEHMLPRFTGNPIRGGLWSYGQQALAHLGLWLLLTGLGLGQPGIAVTGAAGLWISLLVFTLRLWPVLWPPGGGRERSRMPTQPDNPI